MFRKKQEHRPDFPRDQYVPALRKSICTGEESFGFIRLSDRAFLEVQLVRSRDELLSLLSYYAISEDEVETIF